MKKWMIFVGGVVTGIVVTLLFVALYTSNQSDSSETLTEEETEQTEDNDFKFFDEPGEVINEPSVKVFQVLAKDAALVNGYNKEIIQEFVLGKIFDLAD